MQLQQLRYLVAAAECGSIRAAAQKLFVSQSAVSIAVKELELEMGVTIFDRTSKGITLTEEGIDLLGYAQRVLDQVEIMTQYYAAVHEPATSFAVSSLHNLLVAKAFGDFLDAHTDEACDFALRETNINQVIRDVSEERSNVGIIYLSNFNDQVITRVLESYELSFTSLFVAQPYVVVGEDHPLAKRQSVLPEELAAFDRYELEQGMESSTYYENEPLSTVPHRRKIMLDDNSSLAAILAEHDGYSIATGLSPANRALALVPLDTEEVMNVGFVLPKKGQMTPLTRQFVTILCRHILENGDQIEPSSPVFYYTRTKRA